MLHEHKCNEWQSSLSNYPKLRTYITFKDTFCIEPYVCTNMNRKYRSVLAQLRSGILPLEVETGRWRGVEIEGRICKLCEDDCIEDEAHFLLNCRFYADERNTFFDQCIRTVINNFDSVDIDSKFKFLMQENVVLSTAKFVWKIYEKRKSKLFS